MLRLGVTAAQRFSLRIRLPKNSAATMALSGLFARALTPRYIDAVTVVISQQHQHFFSTKAKPAAAAKKVKGADAGRVVLHQEEGKQGKGGPKLCAGCGTEVIIGKKGEKKGFTSGADAVALRERSKKQAKQARFYDTFEGMFKSQFFCMRCKALKEENLWKAYDALHDVSPEVFQEQLRHIVSRRRFGMCIMVVDATDPEHSAIKHLRRSIGKIPCWLVINKIDLVPRMNRNDVQSLAFKIRAVTGSQYVECFPVSAKTGVGIFQLAERILENLRGRDVFVVGCANVGKSSLVQAMAAMIAEAIYLKGKKGEKRRDMAADLKVTGSHLPGTTLQAVRIPCFSSDRHALWDTPGIINRKALQYSLFPSHLMEPLARPDPIPIPTRENGLVGMLSEGYSLLIEAKWMDDDYEEEKDEEGAEGAEEEKDHFKEPKVRTNEPCVLGRIDMINIEGHASVYAQAYLHPSLRVRVVPTSEAPDKATIPASHVKRIQDKIKQATKQKNDVFPESISLPLKIYDTKELHNGEISPGIKCQNPNSGKYHMDLSFASLGWISFTHHGDFTIQPHCVEGSVFSKRRSLYPINLGDYIANGEPTIMEEEAMDDEERTRRLNLAQKAGRHNPKDFEHSKRSFPGSYHSGGGIGVDDFMGYQSEKMFAENEDDDWF